MNKQLFLLFSLTFNLYQHPMTHEYSSSFSDSEIHDACSESSEDSDSTSSKTSENSVKFVGNENDDNGASETYQELKLENNKLVQKNFDLQKENLFLTEQIARFELTELEQAELSAMFISHSKLIK